MVAVEGVEAQGAVMDNQPSDSGSSVLKLSITVQAASVIVQLTVDKLDASKSLAQGAPDVQVLPKP